MDNENQNTNKTNKQIEKINETRINLNITIKKKHNKREKQEIKNKRN